MCIRDRPSSGTPWKAATRTCETQHALIRAIRSSRCSRRKHLRAPPTSRAPAYASSRILIQVEQGRDT
eukprot:2977496-Alexandrium_andersonii.AAC.1